MLSIVIPSYREPYLQRTIDDIRSHAETSIEVITVLDGYTDTIAGASVIQLPKNKGLRNAINKGVSFSRGEYVMKVDGHCSFAQGFDRVLLESIADNEVVIPRRYSLNPETWERSEKYIDYEKLTIHKTRNKFHGEEWRSRRGTNIDETMMFQGSCWVMSKKLCGIVCPLDEENYGPFFQEPVEIAMKVWQAGGRLMVNKNTWYAHKDRSFKRTHNVPSSDQKKASEYALRTYGEYYEHVIKPRFGI